MTSNMVGVLQILPSWMATSKPFTNILLSGRQLFTSAALYRRTNRTERSVLPQNVEQPYGRDDDVHVDPEECEDTIDRAHEFYDLYQREEEEHRKITRRAIVRNKVFKEPPEPNLLMWAAKEQIRYLNKLNPDEWTPKRLAESFPVTVNGVKKLLKSKFVHADENRIQRHDLSVMRNWKLLKEGKCDSVDPTSVHLWLSEGTFELHSQGNKSLPLPSPRIVLEKQVLPQPYGEFSAIVKPYITLKSKQIRNPVAGEHHQSGQNTVSAMTNYTVDTDVRYARVTHKATQNSESHAQNEDFAESQHASYLAADETKYMGPYITQKQYRKNLLETYENKEDYSDIDAAMHQWLKSKKEMTEQFSEIQQSNKIVPSVHMAKYSRTTVELKAEGDQAYTYDSTVGYQYPFGKLSSSPERINVPAHLQKHGAMYKVGENYYDDDGEFLYSVHWK